MKIEYWPLDEFDCDMGISGEQMEHIHCSSDDEVIAALIYAQQCFRRRDDGNPSTLLGVPFNHRYICIRGPGGLVKGLLP